jgi:hypothetical protein
MMKKLLMTIAIIEMTVGIVLLAVPALVASILVGGALDTPTGLGLARLAGAALLSLGFACWWAWRDARSPAAIGIVAAMLLYNLAVVVLFISLRYGAGMTGMGLLPVSALHSALAIWCIACLRAAWQQKILRSRR